MYRGDCGGGLKLDGAMLVRNVDDAIVESDGEEAGTAIVLHRHGVSGPVHGERGDRVLARLLLLLEPPLSAGVEHFSKIHGAALLHAARAAPHCAKAANALRESVEVVVPGGAIVHRRLILLSAHCIQVLCTVGVQQLLQLLLLHHTQQVPPFLVADNRERLGRALTDLLAQLPVCTVNSEIFRLGDDRGIHDVARVQRVAR
mmetsp:Transcript_9287/g.38160  ORF Transcript_9287/g.38160 Transcript_9287/m.38160 type:complete len:202 (+) Transcript_9287:177-782(+)